MPREKKFNRRHSTGVYPASDGELARWDRIDSGIPTLRAKKNIFEVNEIGH